jgi:hypothetical protein
MSATGFGAILVVAGAMLLFLGPSLARSQADLLSGFFQVNLRERGMRIVRWSYLLPGAGLVLVGLVLIGLAQAGVIEDTDPWALETVVRTAYSQLRLQSSWSEPSCSHWS